VNELVRRRGWIALAPFIAVVSTIAACSSTTGISLVDAGNDTSTTGAPDTARAIDANCDPLLTYASFGMDFFATYCNRCHVWTQETAQLSGTTIEDFAGTSTSMPPSAPFPTSDQRMQLVNWIDCGAP
jgi:hypothetical protein